MGQLGASKNYNTHGADAYKVNPRRSQLSNYRYNKFTTGHMMRDMHFNGAALNVGEPFPNFELLTAAGEPHG